MLSKKDKEWITGAIREALTVEIRMERKRNLETGQPLAVPVVEEKKVFLPEFWVTYLPFYEAALRGVQETMDTVKNGQIRNQDALAAVGNIMIEYEKAIRALPEMVGKLQALALEHRKPVRELEELHEAKTVTHTA